MICRDGLVCCESITIQCRFELNKYSLGSGSERRLLVVIPNEEGLSEITV